MPNQRRVEVRIVAVDPTTARFHVQWWDKDGKRQEYSETHPARETVDVFERIESEYEQKGFRVIVTQYEPFNRAVRQMIGLAPLS